MTFSNLSTDSEPLTRERFRLDFDSLMSRAGWARKVADDLPPYDPRATLTNMLREAAGDGHLVLPPTLYNELMWEVRNETDGIYSGEGIVLPPGGSIPL